MKKKFYHAIILARGGSKGIKNKNIIKIGKFPLLYWSIKQSLKSKIIKKTWVSSDSNKILNLAKEFGANTIKRGEELSNDKIGSDPALIHACKFIDEKYKDRFNKIVALQTTSPIRDSDDIDNGIKYFEKHKFDSLFTSNIINDFFIWKKINKKLKPINFNYKKRPNRQNIEDKYHENGSFYIFDKKRFYKEKCRLFGKIGTFTLRKLMIHQIDNYEDLEIMKYFFTKKHIK